MFISHKLSSNSIKLLILFSSLALFLVLSKALGQIYGPVLLFLFIVVSISPLIPSKYVLQRVAVTAILVVGLSPFYLILRGFFTKSNLGNWDLQIYLTSFFTILFLTNLIFNRGVFLNGYLKKLDKKSYIFAGFSSLFVALLTQAVLLNKSAGHAIAWIASGDSKNHFVNGVDISRYGYLDPTLFLNQPVSSPTYLALNLSQSQINLETISDNLSLQMQIYAHVWILLIGLFGLVVASTLEIIWDYFQKIESKIPTHLLVVSSLISTLSLIVGPTLYDGFFTAILGISSIGILISWFLDVFQNKQFSAGQISIGITLLTVSLMAWMFVIPFTLTVFMFGARANFKKIRRNNSVIDIAIISLLFVGASIVHFSEVGQSFIFKAKSALTALGAVSASDPNLYFASILGLILLGIAFNKNNKKLSVPILTIAIASFLALYGFKNFSNLSFFSWNYYLIKYQWMMLAGLFGLITSILLVTLNSRIPDSSRLKFPAVFISAIFIFFASESMVPSNNVWQKIWRGWENPRSSTLSLVLEQEIDRKNPTMFFHYGYAGDAMLANFWLTAFSDPVEPLKGWNYTIDTAGDVQQICDVNAYYPEVTIVTSDSKLEELLTQTCPNEEFTIKLEVPAV